MEKAPHSINRELITHRGMLPLVPLVYEFITPRENKQNPVIMLAIKYLFFRSMAPPISSFSYSRNLS